MLGLREKQKLPVDGFSAITIQGISVYVRPMQQGPQPWTRWGRRAQRKFALRVRAICPICGRDVAASRLPQHTVVHLESRI